MLHSRPFYSCVTGFQVGTRVPGYQGMCIGMHTYLPGTLSQSYEYKFFHGSQPCRISGTRVPGTSTGTRYRVDPGSCDGMHTRRYMYQFHYRSMYPAACTGPGTIYNNSTCAGYDHTVTRGSYRKHMNLYNIYAYPRYPGTRYQ
jgi:hypothetical protein